MASEISSSTAPKYTLADIRNEPRFRDNAWLTQRWSNGYVVAKRTLDLVISVLLLAVFLVTFPFIAIAILFDSRGSVFYRQERVGADGARFQVIKYRSMVQNAEQNGAQFATQNDSRVTKVGNFLRTSRFDELPQVINALRGQMSIVGPRPERPHVLDAMSQIEPAFAMRTAVRPGLTGYAQVHAHYAASEAELLTKLEYDLYYIRNASMWMDLGILIQTVLVVFRRQGT